jgi:hypothetical protein
MGVVERIGILARETVKLRDNAELRLGDGAQGADPGVSDVHIAWDGTDLDMVPTANNTVFKLGTGTYSFDVWLYGSTASKYLVWDASGNTLHGSGGVSVLLEDSNYLKFGNSSDVTMTWDATNLVITAAADDSLIEFGDANATQASFDVRFYGNTASGGSFLEWDASADRLIQSGGGVIANKNITNGSWLTAGTLIGCFQFMVGNSLGVVPVYSTL